MRDFAKEDTLGPASIVAAAPVCREGEEKPDVLIFLPILGLANFCLKRPGTMEELSTLLGTSRQDGSVGGGRLEMFEIC
jgi:hypothetical protein